jgi:murein DD-endopeptidase MepM/ murein hydrolase activator NlpD
VRSGDRDHRGPLTPRTATLRFAGLIAALGVLTAVPAVTGLDIPTTTTNTGGQAPSAPAPTTTSGSGGTAAAPAPAPVRLKLGSRGPVVRDLQRELRRRGAKIAVDGVYGIGTKRAVMRQQKRLRMRVTGVADQRLLAKLGIQTVRVAALKVTTAVPAGVRMDRWPTTGRFESPFGMRWGRMHEGIDISNDRGTPIRAALTGTVVFAGTEAGYGNIVRVDHGAGIETRYAHMSAIRVAEGQAVAPGDVVGLMGATGSATGIHLHFEVRVDGIAYDPLTALPPRPGTVLPGL